MAKRPATRSKKTSQGNGKSKGNAKDKTPRAQSRTIKSPLQGAIATIPPASTPLSPSQIRALREVFWQNVLREILVSLATISQRRSNARTDDDHAADALDGRLGLILGSGKRLSITDVFPVFAAGVGKSSRDRALSAAVECTVFQVRSVEGEVFTIPLSQIRGFHTLDEALMARIQEAARSQGEDGQGEPFGFAAYTSLAKRGDSGDLSGAL
jgi:hypothetical protein